jgi:hypothetical protein
LNQAFTVTGMAAGAGYTVAAQPACGTMETEATADGHGVLRFNAAVGPECAGSVAKK